MLSRRRSFTTNYKYMGVRVGIVMCADTSRTLKSTEKTLEIIELLIERGGARPSTLADILDLSPSTVHAHLATLEQHQYVSNTGGVYDIGLKFMRISRYVRNRDPAYERAKKYTEQLAEETGCRVVFIVEEHGRGTYFHVCSGEYERWDHTDEGSQFHLNTTAAGKAILAELPRERAVEIIERHGLVRRTENTITDRDELVAELDEIEETGYAVNHEEDILGITGYGVSVVRGDGTVLGAFGIGGPVEKITSDWLEDDIISTSIGIASEFELELSL